jgi:hypothetical protein
MYFSPAGNTNISYFMGSTIHNHSPLILVFNNERGKTPINVIDSSVCYDHVVMWYQSSSARPDGVSYGSLTLIMKASDLIEQMI